MFHDCYCNPHYSITITTTITFPPCNDIIKAVASCHKPYNSDGVEKWRTDMTTCICEVGSDNC